MAQSQRDAATANALECLDEVGVDGGAPRPAPTAHAQGQPT